MLKRGILSVVAFLLILQMTGQIFGPALGQVEPRSERSAAIRLGERLFKDERFSTPNGDLPASCSNCHLFDEDPQGLRVFTDFFNRSWVSYRRGDPERLELRNSPTLFDVALMPRLHHDGEFPSLEALVKGTFAGRPMGWLPGEEPQALARMQTILLNDQGEDRGAEGPYRIQFEKAFGVDLTKLSREELADLTAKAVSDFMRTIKSRKNSLYDQFVHANNLAAEPANGESSAAFGQRLLAQVSALESRQKLKLPAGFKADAIRGLKIFFRTTNTNSTAAVGNCVACHTPPLFTDFSFHNVGVSQRDYDKIHGEGQFADLSIPDAANANRPARQFRQVPAQAKSGAADLGHWNFVDLKTSPMRRAGESDDQFLRRMIGAFKTPTLRNLAYSAPYLHTGSLTSLTDVINEMIESSELARAGRLRAVDEEMTKVRIAEGDIPSILAFLGTLNENLKKVH